MNHAAILQDAISSAGGHLDMPEAAGCYVITNKVTGRVYVGQSTNMRKRAIQHMTTLKRGRHASEQMMRDYQEHGAASFVFAVAVMCDSDSLADVERDLIKSAANGPVYNSQVFNPVSATQRGEELRRLRAEQGITRLELYAHKDDHQRIKDFAACVAAERLHRNVHKQPSST